MKPHCRGTFSQNVKYERVPKGAGGVPELNVNSVGIGVRAVLQADNLATWFLRLYPYPNPLPHALHKCRLLCFPLAASATKGIFKK